MMIPSNPGLDEDHQSISNFPASFRSAGPVPTTGVSSSTSFPPQMDPSSWWDSYGNPMMVDLLVNESRLDNVRLPVDIVDQHNNNNTGYCNYDDDNHYNNLGRGDEEQDYEPQVPDWTKDSDGCHDNDDLYNHVSHDEDDMEQLPPRFKVVRKVILKLSETINHPATIQGQLPPNDVMPNSHKQVKEVDDNANGMDNEEAAPPAVKAKRTATPEKHKSTRSQKQVDGI
ncbi:hypothetical protein V8E55_003280 [Tylopilus felleus]